MSITKRFFVLMLLLSVTISCLGTAVSAYEFIDTDWDKQTAFNSEFIVSEAYGKNCISVNSVGNLSVYDKQLNTPIPVDGNKYELSCKVYIPHINTDEDAGKQTFILEGRTKSGNIPVLYGIRIDNGVVAYYNGEGAWKISTAYNGSEKLTISEGEWHTFKTILNRRTGKYRYYVDDIPIMKGDKILTVTGYEKTFEKEINKLTINSRNVSGAENERIYVSDICLRKLERTAGVRVYNAYAKNASGEEISFNDISGNENLTVCFDYDASNDFTVIAAIYSEDENNEEDIKQLKGIYTKRINVAEHGYVCGDTINVSRNCGNRLRLIAVDSINDIKPYSTVTREEAENSKIDIRLEGSNVDNTDITITGGLKKTIDSEDFTLLKAPLIADTAADAKSIRFDSTVKDRPKEKYYIDFKVNSPNLLKRYDGAVYAVAVQYFDEGYGCFTLEYNTEDESFKEAEYVELNNTNELKEKTFYLKDAYFTGEDTDFRLATWGENMRYSNFDVIFANVKTAVMPYCDRFDLSVSGNTVGNIYYTGDTATFTVKISDKSFYDYSKAQGSYTARLKYSLVDENGNTAVFLDENGNHVTEIAKNDIPITPLSTVTDTVSFKPIRYGLYYLKTEVTAEQFKVKSENLTELSYVHSDKTTVNPDYGISFQNNIYTTAGAEELAKNAGIGMLRWVRAMKTVEKVSGKDGNATVVEVADGNGIKYSSGNASHEWRTLEAMAANKGYTFLNNLSAGGMIYSDALVNGYKKQIPYGEIGKNLFADYCGFFAKNAPANTKYYEIWNEFDSGLGTTYNKNGESHDKYAELLVKAADAIYDNHIKSTGDSRANDPNYANHIKKNEDAEIVAMSARFIKTNQLAIDGVKALKGEDNLAKYFKNVSIHPYHWNDNPMEIKPTEKALTDANAHTIYDHMAVLKKVYADDNGLSDTKFWISEIAWSPHFISKFYLDDAGKNELKPIEEYKPITEKQQGSYLVQSYVMAKKNNITEKFLSYLLARQTTARVDRDRNCGILKYYENTGNNVPLAATSAYLAIANMNMFMTGRTYADDFMFASGTAAAYKYTKAGSDDLAILWSTKENGEDVSVNLGVGSVTMYDEYGNAETLTSENGIYNLTLTQSTLYIEGSFNAFEEAN